MALKLLHTADWHLGRRFSMFTEDQEKRLTRARREVVGRILDLAERGDVDAVLCAGDLFDTPTPAEDWWRSLLDEFRSRSSWTRPVFLLPGNHDPLLPNSVYRIGHPFRQGLPAYVHVVDHDDFSYKISEQAILYSSPCHSHAGQQDPTANIPEREPGDERIRIGLVHGQTFDIKDHQNNFPVDPQAAKKLGLDYLALGDTHGFRELQAQGEAPVVYPGTPEQIKFGEAGAGHVAVVFFPLDRRRFAIVKKRPVGTWQWRTQTCSSIEELRSVRADDTLRKCVLRLYLDMTVPVKEYDEAERILRELEGSLSAHPRVGVLEMDRENLHPEIPGIDDFPELPPVLESAVQRLNAHANIEPEKAERALYYLYRIVKEGAF